MLLVCREREAGSGHDTSAAASPQRVPGGGAAVDRGAAADAEHGAGRGAFPRALSPHPPATRATGPARRPLPSLPRPSGTDGGRRWASGTGPGRSLSREDGRPCRSASAGVGGDGAI